MAKPGTAEITKQDITEYLRTQDDLALEMQCLRTCLDQRWETKHGGSYEDPVTGKTRQFDIRAVSEWRNMRISLPVECKALKKSFPLLVSCVPRAKDEATHDVLISHAPAYREGVTRADARTATTVSLGWHDSAYPKGESVGKHTAQVGRSAQGEIVSGDGEVFEKWSQAVASAFDMVFDNAGIFESERRKETVLSVTIPTLVVPDDTLWRVCYNEDGVADSEPEKVSETSVFLGKEYSLRDFLVSYRMSHLHIVTLSAFGSFLDNFKPVTGEWATWFPQRAIADKAAKLSTLLS